ncbi:MAG: DUF3704 domain-containing protein, partial [Verrucomicrobiae bacterium]|nr:DUF3704 domain-containing protein [Verrucomicrobiae bacterium]
SAGGWPRSSGYLPRRSRAGNTGSATPVDPPCGCWSFS